MADLERSLHALVTGGGRGIGREVASELTRAGASVTVATPSTTASRKCLGE